MSVPSAAWSPAAIASATWRTAGVQWSLLVRLPASTEQLSAVAGVGLLIIFKYTSNQSAIGRARDSIKANMLALKLFKDSILVTLQEQGRGFKGAMLLLVYAIRPLFVMIVPVCLVLGQMGLWYQFRPLLPNEEAIVTMKLNSEMNSPLPKVNIEPTPAVTILALAENTSFQTGIYYCSSSRTRLVPKFGLAYLSQFPFW